MMRFGINISPSIIDVTRKLIENNLFKQSSYDLRVVHNTYLLKDMSDLFRKELGDFNSVVCFKAAITGMEDALGEKAIAIALNRDDRSKYDSG